LCTICSDLSVPSVIFALVELEQIKETPFFVFQCESCSHMNLRQLEFVEVCTAEENINIE